SAGHRHHCVYRPLQWSGTGAVGDFGRARHHRAGERQGFSRRRVVVAAGPERGAGDDRARALERRARRLADSRGTQSQALCSRARYSRRADGEYNRAMSARAEQPAPTGQAALLLAEIERLQRDLAAARQKIAELEIRADIDPLLDILNRRGFERELKRALSYVKRYGTQASLMFIDLDGFKAVNDRHGHGTGDALLKALSRQLIARVRSSDIVGRLGGDEFGIVVW